jgi:hypothetical protein
MSDMGIPDIPLAGGREPAPFEKPPARVVFVPYQSIATNQGTDVRYDFKQLGSAAAQLAPGDLRALDKVRYSARQGEFTGVQKYEYSGGLLVDEKNRLARQQYDVNGEPLGLLRSLGVGERSQLLTTLYQKGFYSSGKPSKNGFSGADQNALGNLLEYANSMGRTWNVAYLEVQTLENERGLGGAPSVRVSAREDIRQFVDRDSLELLGRRLSRAEFRQALEMIQARERGAAGGGEQMPSLGALSAQAVQQIAPREVQVNDAADGIDIFREMLRTARG